MRKNKKKISRSKNDAYYSYRRRCIITNKPYMTLKEFNHSRLVGEKRKDGRYKPLWNKTGSRLPLVWLSRYNSRDKLLKRSEDLFKMFLKNNRRDTAEKLKLVVELISILDQEKD